MLKIKHFRTANCVVGGYRYGSGKKVIGSLLLGLYDAQGLLNYDGFTSAIARSDRKSITQKLEALNEAPGFIGSAPGGPSRWSQGKSSEWRPVRRLLKNWSFGCS